MCTPRGGEEGGEGEEGVGSSRGVNMVKDWFDNARTHHAWLLPGDSGRWLTEER